MTFWNVEWVEATPTFIVGVVDDKIVITIDLEKECAEVKFRAQLWLQGDTLLAKLPHATLKIPFSRNYIELE